nr:hypothetical protein [Tanacetum cinerariifolium]
MILDGMLRNLDNVPGKFLMYPRFIQTLLDKQLDGLPTHKEKYDVSLHTKKVFANMKRIGKGFSGKDTPLFPTMAPRHHGDTFAHTRYKRVSKMSSDSLITGVNTPQSDKDSMKHIELMKIYTTLQKEVLDLEDGLKRTKTAQQFKTDSLERRVKKLEKKHRLRTHKLKRLYKVGLTAKVISSSNDEALDKEDTSKQGRIYEINADEDIALVSTHDDMVQDEGIEDGEEEVVEVVTTAKMIIDTTIDDVQVTTSIVDVPVSAVETIVTTAPTITAESTKINVEVQDKGKGKAKLIEEPVKLKKKDQILFDEEVARKLEEEIYEQERLLAERLQAEEQELLTDAKKVKLFMEFMEKRRKFFAAKRTAKKRNKPPTKDQRSIMSTYLKSMDGWKPRALKNKSFAKIKELFDKTIKRINNFIDFQTELVEMNGNSQMYLTFNKLLKNFDREDQKVLWRLVKDRFVKTKPVDDMHSFLLPTLKTMFEHHVKDNVWKNQQGLTKVKNWKLFDSYGVHCITMQNILYYLLVEKMYPLTNHTLHQMFNNVKLQVDDEYEMAYELLRLVKKS